MNTLNILALIRQGSLAVCFLMSYFYIVDMTFYLRTPSVQKKLIIKNINVLLIKFNNDTSDERNIPESISEVSYDYSATNITKINLSYTEQS